MRLTNPAAISAMKTQQSQLETSLRRLCLIMGDTLLNALRRIATASSLFPGTVCPPHPTCRSPRATRQCACGAARPTARPRARPAPSARERQTGARQTGATARGARRACRRWRSKAAAGASARAARRRMRHSCRRRLWVEIFGDKGRNRYIAREGLGQDTE